VRVYCVHSVGAYYYILYIIIIIIIILYERKPSRSNPRARQFPGLINNQGERLNSNTDIDSWFFFFFLIISRYIFFGTFCRLTRTTDSPVRSGVRITTIIIGLIIIGTNTILLRQ